MVERGFHTAKVTGSSPVVPTICLGSSGVERPAHNRRVTGSKPVRGTIFVISEVFLSPVTKYDRGIAKLVKALGSESGMRRFESCYPCQFVSVKERVMRPMGRRPNRMPVGKWKVKDNGKHVKAWWEDTVSRSKTSVRMRHKRTLRRLLGS